MYTYKKIPESDKNQLFHLIDVVLKTLPNPNYFVPYEQWELDSMFDEVNYAHLYGAYDEKKLLGSAQLYSKAEIYDAPKDQSIDSEQQFGEKGKFCEFGGALVLPEYRNQGIMTNLGALILNQAKGLGFDYIIATAYPEDIPAWKVVEKLGFNFVRQAISSGGWVHKLYMKKLD